MASHSRRKRQHTEDFNNMEVDRDNHWSENHRLFLQYLLHSRMIKKIELSRVHGKLFHDSESLSESLKTITNKVKVLKMDIKQVNCDITGDTFNVLIHTTGEPFFPRCCIFSKSQLDFLKKILTSIALSTEGKIGRIEALNSCNSMSKSEADDSLGTFVKEKILMEIGNGEFCLTPLAVVEFGPFFNSCFQDNMSTCDLCKQLVFVGRICDRDSCRQKYHFHCVSKWMIKRNGCPNCGQDWSSDMDADTE